MIEYYIFIFIFGICLGSFLNALEWRMRHKISLLDARSKCPRCKAQLKWYDNIPLVSFLVLGGKCRACREKISWQYPLVEIIMGIFFVLPFLSVSFPNWEIWLWIFFQWLTYFCLVFIFVYDLKYQEVLDSMTLIPAILIFLVNYIIFGISWQSMLLGAGIGAGFFLLQFIVSKGKWIGGGDIRIGLLMGVVLGWKLLLVALWIAYVIGAVVSIGLVIAKKKQMSSKMAFGTFLSVATFVVLVYGEGILAWYIKLLF